MAKDKYILYLEKERYYPKLDLDKLLDNPQYEELRKLLGLCGIDYHMINGDKHNCCEGESDNV